MPSTSPGRPTNRPNSVAFLTSPSTTEPTGCASAKAPHGFDCACLRPSEMRRFSLSTSRTMTSTSWLVETILPGWTFFLTHDISLTWTRPSKIGRAHVCTPVTNAHLVCRLLLEKNNNILDTPNYSAQTSSNTDVT